MFCGREGMVSSNYAIPLMIGCNMSAHYIYTGEVHTYINSTGILLQKFNLAIDHEYKPTFVTENK